MKVITNVSLIIKDEKTGKEVTLPPGEHTLPTDHAKDAIERGFAVEAGKAPTSAPAPAPEGGQDPSILDGSVPEIVAQLDGLTAEQLDQLTKLERAGKNRKGVLDAIEEAKEDLED